MYKDKIYYNIEIKNSSQTQFTNKAIYIDKRSEPIINTPKDYYLSVIRISLSGILIPIFIYPNTGVDGSRVVNNTVYSLTLKTAAGSYRAFTIFNYSSSPNIPSTIEPYYYIYSFQQFIKFINTAFETAFNDLKTMEPSNIATKAPFMVYDNKSLLISIIIQPEYKNNISIYFNDKLYAFFESFDIKYYGYGNIPNGLNVELLINDKHTNYTDYEYININTTSGSDNITSLGLFKPYMSGCIIKAREIPLNTTLSYIDANTMKLSNNATGTTINNYATIINTSLIEIKQDYQTSYLWTDLKNITLISNMIPINHEFLPNNNYNDNSSNDNYLNILTDFVPPLGYSGDIRSQYIYNPTAEYRRIKLRGTTPINIIDCSLYWKDLDNRLHEIYLSPDGSGVSIKLLFEKI